MEKTLMDINDEDRSYTELKKNLISELEHGILPFWLKYSLDEEHGGFYGRVDNKGQAVPGAPKALILNTRILWSFSAAYSFFPDSWWYSTTAQGSSLQDLCNAEH